MAEAVIRDADDMLVFAKELESYEEGVKAFCDALKGKVQDAGQFMKDDNSRKALESIETTLDEIRGSVPNCTEISKKLAKSAMHIREASETARRI